jgi:hypothetical protein
MEIPCLIARPDLGCTNATYPLGRAMLIPVGTNILSPGLIVKSIRVAKSAPASPAFAYEGSGTVGSSRLIKILVMG